MSYYDFIDQYRKSYRIYLPEGSTVYDAKNLLFSKFKIEIDRFDYVANSSRYTLIDNYNLSQLAKPLNYFEINIRQQSNPSFQYNGPMPPPQQSTFVPTLNSVEIPDDSKIEKMTKIFNSREEITTYEKSIISNFSTSQQEELINLRKYFWNNDKINMRDIVRYYELSKYNIHLTKENLEFCSSVL